MSEPTKQDRWSAIVWAALGPMGRMLSGSKSSYSDRHPKNVVFFNGNIYDKDGKKLWYGDVNLTKDKARLEQIAHMLDEPIYVTREQPFRWEEQTTESLENCTKGEYPSVVRIDP